MASRRQLLHINLQIKMLPKYQKNGTIKAKGKGKTVITVKIKLEDGRTKTVKKKITVK